MNVNTFDIDDDVAEWLMKITVTVGAGDNKRTFTRDFRPDVTPNYDLLEEQLVETPPLLCFWSQVLAEARARVSLLDRKMRTRRGEIMRELTDEAKRMASEGIGLGSRAGLRKSDIEDLMEQDEKLIGLDVEYITARKIESKVYGIIEALRTKSENLRSLAGFKRMEMQESG